MSDQPVNRTAATADFTFKAGAYTGNELRVLGFSGVEGLSRLFDFSVQLGADQADVAIDALLGKACVLEIAAERGSRFVHGMVRRFELVGQSTDMSYFVADVVPVHWFLTKRQASRIFQSHWCGDMTVPGIIRKVFELAGIPTDTWREALSGSYAAREYVVQYRESDFDFISRLMEEEGIYYFFEHTVKGHKMVLADGAAAHVASALSPECHFHEHSGLALDDEHFNTLRATAEIQVGAVRLTDFDYNKPGTHLRALASGPSDTALELSDYPGRFLEKPDGDRYAAVRLAEHSCRRRVITLGGTVRGLLPGDRVTLKDHPRAELNREYLVTHVAHQATQAESSEAGTRYGCDVRAIPADATYRPPRVTPRPFVRGCQTARVVGPSGEEIYTDALGRVKVQFHWDLAGEMNENSSCWLRVSQALAGGNYGMLFLPRVGQEVVVDFLEGDPDRPLITGGVYNADHKPPYTLPDEKTRTVIKSRSSKGGGGANEISFNDLKDSEKLLLYAQKDYHLRVLNDRVETVQGKAHTLIEKDAFEKIKQKLHREITLDASEKIGGKRSLKVTGDDGIEVGGNHSLKSAGKLYLKSEQEIVLEGAIGLTLKVGGNFVKIDPSGVSVVGTLTRINSGGAAGSATPVALAAPEAPVEADKVQPGVDKTYSPATLQAAAIEPPPSDFAPVEVVPPEPVTTSWIELEMVDEEGQPWRGEHYEITLPDGRVLKGRLNDEGQARVGLPRNEAVQVAFPNLDTEAWERL